MKQKMDELKQLCAEAKEELLHHIIPFWEGMQDFEHGGFYGYMGQDFVVDKTYDKGCILNSRILWFFSEAYLTLGDEKLLSCADSAWTLLEESFVDHEEGGLFWSVTYDGQPKDMTKHTYNQAFAIYGLCSYYKASKNRKALDLAFTLFHLIEEKMRDENGYLEAFNRDFTPASNDKLSENGVCAKRPMNTIRHVMEAYTNLAEVTGEEVVRERLREILTIIVNAIYNPDLCRQEVFFDLDYNSLIDLYSYGHDIEAAWLIDDATKQAYIGYLGDGMEMGVIGKMVQEMEQQVYKEAYNGTCLPEEKEDGKVRENRVWWIQAEAVNGFVNAWEKNPKEEKYLDAARNIWDYIREYLIDKRPGGEWFWEVDPEGKPLSEHAMADPWKCPYHNGRMCLLLIRREEHAS